MAAEVNARSAAVTAMQPTWDVIQTLLGGTPAMRAKGIAYLPKQPREEQGDYDYRVSVSTLFPAYRRTLSVMSGKPFSKALTFGEDVPPEILEWADDIDLEGINLHTFAAEMFREGFYGLAGILVEAPPPIVSAGRSPTRAEQRQAKVRPYFVRVLHSQIIGFRVETINGVRTLTQLRLRADATVPDGEFGEKVVERVRVLTPGAWALWRKVEKTTTAAEHWVIEQDGTTTLKVIPFVPVYGHRIGFMAGEPPLADLAYLNVKHWQSQSDQDESVRYSRKRLLVVSGVTDESPITASSSYAISLPMGAEMKVVQGSAEAVTVGRAELAALEDQMIQAGAELLVKKPGDRSATESANDAEANKCDLQRMAEGFEDSLDQALQFMADYAGLPSGGHVSLYKDFGASTLSDASAQLIRDLMQAGIISEETGINELKRRGVLSAEVTAEDEREKLDNQPPALGLMTDKVEDPPAGPQADPEDTPDDQEAA